MKKLNKIPEKNPFRVPEGYFEEVNRKIISATTGSRKAGIVLKLKPYLLAAASITGFIVLSYTAIRLSFHHKINTIESEAVQEEYYSPFLNELDTYSIEETASSLAVPVQGPDVSKDEIIEYLELENIDISDIYEQL